MNSLLLAKEIVQPNLAPKTYEKYERSRACTSCRTSETRRLDKLQVRDIRQWLNKLGGSASAARRAKMPPARQENAGAARSANAVTTSCLPRSRKDARDALRAALTCAVEEEIITRNPVGRGPAASAANSAASAARGPSMRPAGSSNQPATQGTALRRLRAHPGPGPAQGRGARPDLGAGQPRRRRTVRR